MQAFRVDTVIGENGSLTVENLPLKTGEAVEVIVMVKSDADRDDNPYPLRGMPVTYIDPFEPVADTAPAFASCRPEAPGRIVPSSTRD
jgi:hypothetical protein